MDQRPGSTGETSGSGSSVVVLITDEEDDHELATCNQKAKSGSPGDPPGWYAALVAAKGGVDTNIVVLSLIGPAADPCPALDKCGGGDVGAEVAPWLVAFTEMFTYGSVGQICAPSYTQFFSDAISVIAVACDSFSPQGDGTDGCALHVGIQQRVRTDEPVIARPWHVELRADRLDHRLHRPLVAVAPGSDLPRARHNAFSHGRGMQHVDLLQ